MPKRPIRLRQRLFGRPPVASGLFLCHVPGERVLAHYDRLRGETEGLVEWTLVADEGHLDDPRGDERFPHPSKLMRRRFAEARVSGRIDAAGMMDLVIVPRVVAAPRRFVWAVEYDVDFSGRWSDFFARFARNDADLLTTTLEPRGARPDWAHWSSSHAPQGIAEARWWRAFHPICRLSRRFARAYAAAMRKPGWGGHYEFTLPTVAHHFGFRAEDIRATRPRWNPFAPPYYDNTPGDPGLVPGTFVWRPTRPAYFHERPDQFPARGRLWHPVKPEGPIAGAGGA